MIRRAASIDDRDEIIREIAMRWLTVLRRPESLGRGMRRQSRRRSPAVDPLEPRSLLATLTVTALGDHGPGTLRQALAMSSNGDSIQFAPQVQGKTIRLNGKPLVVGTSVTFGELGTPGVTITARGRSGVFVIDPGVQARFQSLTIQGGKANQGGGIANFGGLDLSGCILRANRAVRGGAVFNQSTGTSTDPSLNGSTPTSGTLTVENSAFLNNAAVAGAGHPASGGAIASVNGHITVSASTFNNNLAAGGSHGGRALGGAIEAISSVVSITRTLFAQNMASGGSGAGDGIGGAIDIQASPAQSSAGVPNQTALSNDTFDGNRARGGKGGGNGLGGAVRVANDLSSGSNGVSISQSTFAENQSVGGSGSRGGDGAGGAIKLGSESGTDNTILMTLDGNTYTGNQAIGGNGKLQGGDGQGGAVDLLANQGSINGPAMAVLARIVDGLVASRIKSSNSTALGNTATGGAGGGGGEGGVFHLGFGGGTLALEDSQFTGNSAIGGPGRPAHGAAAGGTGGAVLVDSGSISLSNVDATGNSAMGTKGSFTGGHGGGLAVLNGTPIVPGSDLQLINDNQAQPPDQNVFQPG